MSKLIVFAGLPGTGKTTLARMLAKRLGAVLLNKDDLRSALFNPEDIPYSDAQNDLCMEIIYQLCAYHLKHKPERPVIIDGRTYSKRYQVDALLKHVQAMHCELKLVECRCDEATAMARLQHDRGTHPARDRDARLYCRVQAECEPMELPRVVLYTDIRSTEELLAELGRVDIDLA